MFCSPNHRLVISLPKYFVLPDENGVVVYELHLKYGANEWIVTSRYSSLLRLHEELKKEIRKDGVLPPFPRKRPILRLIGKILNDDEIQRMKLEDRRRSLEEYFRRLMLIEELQQSPTFSSFLELPSQEFLHSCKKEVSKDKIGTPFNVTHNIHVDDDLQWLGKNPREIFQLQARLGNGSFGKVYRANHTQTGFTMAIKIVKDIQKSKQQTIENEIDILKICKHPNIVSYYGTCNLDDSLWILMEYCSLGSIRDLMDISSKTFSEEQIGYIIQETLHGLIYLHSKHIIHRDVKSANILITEEARVKIADFGVSEQLQYSHDSDEVIGTPHWMAPEVVLTPRYDSKCDIWSLGITIIEIAEGAPPYHNLSPMHLLGSLPENEPPTFKEPSTWSSSLLEFLASCLTKDPILRPSGTDLLTFDFLKRSRSSHVMRERINECMKLRAEKKTTKNSNNDSNNEDMDSDSGTHFGTFPSANSHSSVDSSRLSGEITQPRRLSMPPSFSPTPLINSA
eukprot:TRINITY_DN15071_c0_g1_i1.p1 TRINITY_DN15071_c0_g1~~TRINITY_DN15071_c0_g1_i1.p1  ORF type:complete len:510 (+),score=95.20 TRINITY_DN15071_c0_g1_i1:50-1579(+)